MRSGVIGVLAILACAYGAYWYFVESNKLGTDFSKYKPMALAVAKADKVTLYEGQHRGKSLTPQPIVGNTVAFHGYDFHEKPVALRPDDARRLTAYFCSDAAFRAYDGPKKCGEFSPDFCIEWRTGSDVYQVMLCFGCQEAKCWGPRQELLCDIQDRIYEEFKAILLPYETPINAAK